MDFAGILLAIYQINRRGTKCFIQPLKTTGREFFIICTMNVDLRKKMIDFSCSLIEHIFVGHVLVALRAPRYPRMVLCLRFGPEHKYVEIFNLAGQDS